MAYPLRIPMLHRVYYRAPHLSPYSSPCTKRSTESSWHCYNVPVCRWYYHVLCWRICGPGDNNAEQSSRRTRLPVQTELPGTTPQKVWEMSLKRNYFIGPLGSLNVNQQLIKWTSSCKLLGVTIDNKLTWTKHISELKRMFVNKLNLIKRSRFLPLTIWGCCTTKNEFNS